MILKISEAYGIGVSFVTKYRYTKVIASKEQLLADNSHELSSLILICLELEIKGSVEAQW